MIALLPFVPIAHALPWEVGASDASHLIAARGDEIRVWAEPPTGDGVDLSPTGPSRPGASDVCVRDDRVAIATDWAATVEIRGVDGAPGPTLTPGVKRVGAVACLEGGGWAVIGFPAIPVRNPEAVGTGPGIVFFFNSLGLPIDRWEVPSGAVALAPSGVRGVAALAESGAVWEGKPGAPPRVTELLAGGKARALARSSAGTLVAASVQQACVAGGTCFAANGGAGRLAASTTAIAVGGFESTVVYTPAGTPLLTVPGWPGMLSFDADGDLTVLQGTTLLRFDGRTWAEVGRMTLGRGGER